ncbi:hypothetical protein GF382_03800, partial [Candidatus Falkowbacteria bacterium]|nr:hypothetical protein [Candidatus Falkowbacteria bacterium]
MKRSELFLSFILVPIDFIMIVLAGMTAYHIRFSDFTRDIRPVIFELPFSYYFNSLLIIATLWLVIFAFSGLYNIKT